MEIAHSRQMSAWVLDKTDRGQGLIVMRKSTLYMEAVTFLDIFMRRNCSMEMTRIQGKVEGKRR